MLTIFVGTYNRLDTLTRSIDSFQQMKHDYQVVIVDNGSDHPACIKLLNVLKKRPEVKKVYRLGKVDSMPALTDNYNIALKGEYRSDSEWFAVTDADICFDGTSNLAFDAYIRVAKKTGFAVGPHTRVDDKLSYGYPLRSMVLATQSRLLYKHTMDWLGPVPYSYWPIDTTFHVFPAAPEHRRLQMNTMRCGPPYDAMHLDWYSDVFNPTQENNIYIVRQPGIGSWGRTWMADFWIRFQEDQEKAFEHLKNAPVNPNNDLCINSFMLSWAYQIGLGGEDKYMQSVECLHRAIPRHCEHYWEHEGDWGKMIYNNNFACLGWT
jgi:hypothetical protein